MIMPVGSSNPVSHSPSLASPVTPGQDSPSSFQPDRVQSVIHLSRRAEIQSVPPQAQDQGASTLNESSLSPLNKAKWVIKEVSNIMAADPRALLFRESSARKKEVKGALLAFHDLSSGGFPAIMHNPTLLEARIFAE